MGSYSNGRISWRRRSYLTRTYASFCRRPGCVSSASTKLARFFRLRSTIDLISSAREASVNKIVSRRLDSIAALTKKGLYADALRDLAELGQDFDAFDKHQKARWHLIHAASIWNVHSAVAEAADEFLLAADLCDDDDKLAAARIRGHLMKGDAPTALIAARQARERFPASLTVWVSLTNARMLAGETVQVQDIPADFQNEAAARVGQPARPRGVENPGRAR